MCYMNKDNVIIRRATIDDSYIVAKAAIMAVGDNEVNNWLGSKGYDIFNELAITDDSPYCYKNALVAEILPISCRDNPIIAGAIIGYDGALHLRHREVLYKVIEKHIGYCSKFELETCSNEFYIDSLGVLKNYRGMGIGSKLITALKESAIQNGFYKIKLLVDVKKEKTIELYKSLGFKKSGSRFFLEKLMWDMEYKIIKAG